MRLDDWITRARLFVQRFWQPTSACIACMPGSFAAVANVAHWEIALRTGLATGLLVILLSFTPLIAVFRHRYWNALAVGCLTAIGDAWSHLQHGQAIGVEALVTGVVSGLIALAAAYAFEDGARRLRGLWRRVVPH